MPLPLDVKDNPYTVEHSEHDVYNVLWYSVPLGLCDRATINVTILEWIFFTCQFDKMANICSYKYSNQMGTQHD